MYVMPAGGGALRRGLTGTILAVTVVQILAACQAPPRTLAPGTTDQPAGIINVAPGAFANDAGRSRFVNTVQVKRGLLRDAVTMTGAVVPGRSTQLTFSTSGTVSAVRVLPGDVVRRDEVLIEISLDPIALQTARTQADLAEVTYESQRAKVETLRQGGGPDTVAAAQAAVTHAETSFRKAEQTRAASGQVDTPDVALLRIAAQQAQDDAAAARTNLQRARSLASAELNTAASAVQAAQRKLDVANAAVDQAAAVQSDPSAAQAVSLQEIRVRQAQADLDSARANEQRLRRTAQQTLDLAKASEANVRQTAKDAVDDARAAEQRAREIAAAQLEQAKAAEQAGTGAAAASSNAAQSSARPQQIVVDPNAASPAPGGANTRRVTELQGQQAIAQAVQNSRDAQERNAFQVASAAAAVRTAQEQGDGQIATAVDAARSAERAVQTEQVALDQLVAKHSTTDATTVVALQQARLAKQQAEADLVDAQAAYSRLRQGLTTVDPLAAEAAARSADRKSDAANRQLTQAIADQPGKAELADLQVRAARADLAATLAKVDQLQHGTTANELRVEQQRLDLLGKQVDIARRAAQPTVNVMAPFDGTVTLVGVRVGDLVQPRGLAVSVADPNGLSVVASASQYDIAKLNRSMLTEVTFPGLGDTVTAGTVVGLSGAAVTAAGSATSSLATGANVNDQPGIFPVQIDLASQPEGLRVGMTASITVSVRELRDALSLPAVAVRTGDGPARVTLVNASGQSTEAPVQVGGSFGSDVQITSGVTEGDTVVLHTPSVLNAGRAAGARTTLP